MIPILNGRYTLRFVLVQAPQLQLTEKTSSLGTRHQETIKCPEIVQEIKRTTSNCSLDVNFRISILASHYTPRFVFVQPPQLQLTEETSSPGTRHQETFPCLEIIQEIIPTASCHSQEVNVMIPILASRYTPRFVLVQPPQMHLPGKTSSLGTRH